MVESNKTPSYIVRLSSRFVETPTPYSIIIFIPNQNLPTYHPHRSKCKVKSVLLNKNESTKKKKIDDSANSKTYAIDSFEIASCLDNVCPEKDTTSSTLSCSMKSKKNEEEEEEEMNRINGQFDRNDYIKRKRKISRTTEEVNAYFMPQSLRS